MASNLLPVVFSFTGNRPESREEMASIPEERLLLKTG